VVANITSGTGTTGELALSARIAHHGIAGGYKYVGLVIGVGRE
jgi:hypothetical protein